MDRYAWEPTADYIEQANATRLMRAHGIIDYRDLVARSQDDVEWFWDAAVRDLGIEFTAPYERILDDSRGPMWPRWFDGGEINLAANCVDRHAARPDRADAPAIVWEGEDGATRTITYERLRDETARVAAGLSRLGIGPGDVVGVFMPMVPEAVIAAYGCARLGAVYLPIFSGFGPAAVAARLDDAGARCLVTADCFLRRGRRTAMSPAAAEAASAAAVEAVVVWSRFADSGPVQRPAISWDDAFGEPGAAEPAALDPESPFMIAYTSGTTGKPKGAVHVHGGFLVKIAAEVAYQADVRFGDVLFWVTDMGWIMGPWEMVGAHAAGAAVLMYEGAPDHPGPDRLWDLCERHGVSVLGVSPTLVRALMASGDEPVGGYDLSGLRILASTGEPWNPRPYRWLAGVVGGGRCPIINISGGTEVGACFLGQAPVLPTKECSLGTPSLGMAVDVYGPDGAPVRNRVGELVCTKPWPAQTRGFWGAPERYEQSYWSRWPGVWVHGDWASIDADGYWYLHGRSDDTLNVAGKRIGPAEVESAAVGHPSVVECAAVGVPDAVKGEVVWCFCVPAAGIDSGPATSTEVADLIAADIGKAFAPTRVCFVPELPKTRSAKIMRRTIKAIVVGDDPGDLSSLDNPGALEHIERAVSGAR